MNCPMKLDEMHQAGEVRRGREVGYCNEHLVIWRICIDCGEGKFIRRCRTQPQRCRACSNKKTHSQRRGLLNHNWKGGRNITVNRYIKIRVYEDDFYHSMADSMGYVLEHRLVMAKSLGRSLHSWEIIHHINGIREDNRIENLQLVSDDRHKQITIMDSRIKRLEKRVLILEAENVLLKGENNGIMPTKP